ncbi:FAD binding domain-containing protein [Natronorubrum bangense]|uniref:Xanthine dehydrogenase family protein subunit M n=2 Tax=Natronorubrum bangense TaxID=61858 RepID=A0A4D6HPX9_9EURY|nr:xanthine dehydrogenase family protein subunit M [Natronorubrum bangense]ELY43201.1 nicotine dehydrogenase chain A [Natronorubrum bangense JCM 10635]QCC53293.1 xanthine dehydrogenase family protein subunit M [Natronorubrum bangense]QCC56013.1 xanthine dehydrogenase family protein subunit M [Natronorubrum bangense]
MKPAQFEQHEPETVEEAVSLLESLDDRAILSGGQSMVPMLRFRLAVPETIIDINRIESLDYLEEDDGWLTIGALARHADIEHSELIAEHYGSFADTAPLVADPQIRNRGTVAGSIAQADPKGDWGSVLLAHEGEIVAHGPDGERVIPADEFFLLPYDTTLDENELLTELRVPTPAPREGSAYHKLKRKVGDYAMAGSAARLVLDDDGRIEQAGIGLTAVDITNVRATDAEDHLEGERPSSELFKRAGELAAEQSNPESDEHGDVEYKERMVNVLTQRALGDAAERAGLVKRRVSQ